MTPFEFLGALRGFRTLAEFAEKFKLGHFANFRVSGTAGLKLPG